MAKTVLDPSYKGTSSATTGGAVYGTFKYGTKKYGQQSSGSYGAKKTVIRGGTKSMNLNASTE